MAKEDDRTGMVQVELSEDDWKQSAEKLASEETFRFKLREKKQTHNRKWNEELIQLNESIRQLTDEVETHMAWKPAQADMFGANDAEAGDEEEPKPARRGKRNRRSAGNHVGDAA